MNDLIKALKPIRAQFRAARVLCLHAGVTAALVASPAAFKRPAPSFIALPMSALPATVSAENLFTDKKTIFSKSSAQVAPSVLPQMVIPAACELKLEGEEGDRESIAAKRPSPLTIRASDSQKDILRRKAKTAGVSLNRYMLAAGLGAEDRPLHDPEWTKALLDANRELTRQGNNLNQLTYKRNANLIDEAQTNSMLGIMIRAYLQTHKAVRDALSQGREPQP